MQTNEARYHFSDFSKKTCFLSKEEKRDTLNILNWRWPFSKKSRIQILSHQPDPLWVPLNLKQERKWTCVAKLWPLIWKHSNFEETKETLLIPTNLTLPRSFNISTIFFCSSKLPHFLNIGTIVFKTNLTLKRMVSSWFFFFCFLVLIKFKFSRSRTC
jgi:hypothetical protein